MRVKSFPRRVNPNRSKRSYSVKNEERRLEIVYSKNESFVDLKNPVGLDLSTKKTFKNRTIFRDERKSESCQPILPKICDLEKSKYFHELQIRNNLEVSVINPNQDKMKDSFLYRIMTDPQFAANLQKNRKKKPSCQFCKREFETEEDVKDHLNVRLDEFKRVSCCACGKSFAQKRYLRYHQRCHSDRSKYVCGICLKKYSRMDNLTRHNIFHTNPDKFPCTMCERAFARKDLLNKHQKSHENKYKWYCNTCRKYFKGPVTLDNHMKIFHTPQVNCNKSPVTCSTSEV